MFPSQNADPVQAQLYNFTQLHQADRTQEHLVALFTDIKEKAQQTPSLINGTDAWVYLYYYYWQIWTVEPLYKLEAFLAN